MIDQMTREPRKEGRPGRDLKKHSCPVCSKMFAFPYQVQEHQRVHTRQTPLQCKYCPKLFRWAASKKQHERQHENGELERKGIAESKKLADTRDEPLSWSEPGPSGSKEHDLQMKPRKTKSDPLQDQFLQFGEPTIPKTSTMLDDRSTGKGIQNMDLRMDPGINTDKDNNFFAEFEPTVQSLLVGNDSNSRTGNQREQEHADLPETLSIPEWEGELPHRTPNRGNEHQIFRLLERMRLAEESAPSWKQATDRKLQKQQ